MDRSNQLVCRTIKIEESYFIRKLLIKKFTNSSPGSAIVTVYNRNADSTIKYTFGVHCSTKTRYMKKNLFVICALLILASCTEKKSETTTETREKNLAAVNEINKAIETGDVSKLGDHIAADGIDHASPFGDIKGIDSIKAMLGKIHTMGTNMKMEVIKTVADDDHVFQWMRLTGTTASPDFGMPVGTAYDINAIQVTKFKDGKATEHWEFMQPADMARMLAPQSPKPVIKDSMMMDSLKR